LDPHEVMNGILSACKKRGVTTVAVGFTRSRDQMVRFSNNSVTVVNSWQNETPTVYLASNGKRAACRIEEQRGLDFESIASDLVDSMNVIPRGDVDFDLPKGPFTYQEIEGIYDRRLAEIDTGLVDAAEVAIDSARKEGAERVSGVVISGSSEHFVLTSAGAEGSSKGTEIEITVRAFATDDATGQGISIATDLDRFHPAEAGATAGSIARKARGATAGTAGKYTVVFGPAIFADLVDRVADSASAYSVDLGLSFFQDSLGKKVASEKFSLYDNGRLPNGPGSIALDDEGFPTGETLLIARGTLESYLHTSYTAAKHKARLTGSAQFEGGVAGMVPAPRNLIVEPGEERFEDLLDKAQSGLYITNNWYTRFQNYRTGDFSTICRDGVFEIRGGKLGNPVKGLRVSDNMIRILQTIEALSKKRDWVRWWEVPTPTLTPYVLVRDVGITTASR
jgi:PmbA protein